MKDSNKEHGRTGLVFIWYGYLKTDFFEKSAISIVAKWKSDFEKSVEHLV